MKSFWMFRAATLLLLAVSLLGFEGKEILLADESSPIQAIIEAGKKENQVQDHLDHLTNQIGPRLTSSSGLTLACDWAKERFEKMGLANARLERWGEFPVGFDRGPSFGKMIEPKVMNLAFSTNAWTAGTKGNVPGPAMMSPKSMEELEQRRSDFVGAYVLVPRSSRTRSPIRSDNDRPATKNDRPPTVEQPPELGAEASERTTSNPPSRVSSNDSSEATKIRDELLKSGVAGILYSTLDDLILTGGNYQVKWDELPTVPMINLQKSQWDEISKLLESGEKVRLSFDIRNHFRKGPIPLYNVIAEIPGTQFPDEYVIVGGHIDSWDGATGATDNAAGCATTIEAARILMSANARPKRSIRFMLWSGEEQGLLGSRAYVEQHTEEMAKISAVLVHDGGTNYVAGIGGTTPMIEIFEKIFAPAKTLDERTPFEIRKVEQILPRGGSDHVSFIRAGVPGFFWDQKGRATYRTTHHTQFDTYDAVVPEYQIHSSIVIAIGAYGIANLDSLLPREGVQRGR